MCLNQTGRIPSGWPDSCRVSLLHTYSCLPHGQLVRRQAARPSTMRAFAAPRNSSRPSMPSPPPTTKTPRPSCGASVISRGRSYETLSLIYAIKHWRLKTIQELSAHMTALGCRAITFSNTRAAPRGFLSPRSQWRIGSPRRNRSGLQTAPASTSSCCAGPPVQRLGSVFHHPGLLALGVGYRLNQSLLDTVDCAHVSPIHPGRHQHIH